MTAGPDEFVARPVPLGVAIAVAVATLAAVTLVTSPTALLLGMLGVLAIALGAYRGVRALVGIGVAAILVGVIVGALGGTPAELLVMGTAGAVIAWDAARQAIDLGGMIGTEGRARRALLVHVSAVFATITVVASFGYAVFRIAGGGRPTTSLVLLLFGAFLLAVILR